MKKFALSLVAVAACAGAFRAYGSYQSGSESYALLAENVEALSAGDFWNDLWAWISGDDEDEIRVNAKTSSTTVKEKKTVTVKAGSSISASIRIIKVDYNPNGSVTYTYEKEVTKPCNMCDPDPKGKFKTCDDVPQKC